jgi:crotonobetainyl-CoA:carnitine CoA-transferase CaiB-like acyl-CoA transferase
VPRRFGYGARTSDRSRTAVMGSFHRCKDGWVTGLGQQANWQGLVEWLTEKGFADDLADPKYSEREERNRAGAHIYDILARFAASCTMEELVEDGQRHGMFLFPTYTAREIVNDPHLKARDFFREVEYAHLDEPITYPGPPYRLQATPARARPAPRLGEHNLAVYHEELGVAQERLLTLKALGVI